MKRGFLIWVIIALFVGAVAGYLFGYYRTELLRIESFEACVEAGYPVMESYPEQCATPDGRTFVRAIGDVEDEEDGVACTMDAQLCPDGSYVGRVPPSCEFAPCP